jgi:hypothetical protein
MKRVFLSVVLTGATLVGTAGAQVGPPMLGYLPDSGALRAMTGIPASGSIGPILGSGQVFTQLVASPSGTFALADNADGTVMVVTVASDGVTLNTVVVAGATAGNLQLSPSGSSGLISNGGVVQAISGLPGAPTAQPAVDTTYLGAASALAVSDDGQWVAGVFGGSVYALATGGQAEPLPAPSGVSALAFYRGTDDLAATTANQVVTITGIAATPASTTVFGSANAPVPPESPIAIALTEGNAQIVLLEPDGGIGEIDLTSGSVTTANCGCTPQGLNGLSGSVFRISNLAGGAVKLYDADSGNVLFVPLAPAGAQGGQQ